MSTLGPNPFRDAKRDRPSARQVQEFHTNADSDGSTKALHHTLGPGPTQAAAGNHSHDAGSSSALSGYSLSTHNHNAQNGPAWIALPYVGGWVDFGSGYQPSHYRKVGDIVEVRGMMKHAVTTTTGGFAQLPAGHWPPNICQFICMGSGGGPVDVRINAAGLMQVSGYGASANGGSIQLMQIRFSVL